MGVAMRRMMVSGTLRIVGLAMLDSSGIARGVFTTANPPGVVSDWAIVSNTPTMSPVGNGGYSFECSIHWASDTMAYAFDPTSGVYVSRNAGMTWSRIWGVTNNASGEGFIQPDPDGDDGTVWIALGVGSSGSGSNDGVWKLTNCDAAGGTVENGTITKSEIRRGSTSFENVGPFRAFDDGRVYVMDLGDSNNMAGNPPKMWYTDDSGATWEDIANAQYRETVRKVRSMAVDSEGTIAISMAGPALFIGYNGDENPDPVDQDSRVRITQASFSIPDASVPLTPPDITSFSPSTAEEGDTVTITGTDFTGATFVFLAGESISFTVVNDTTITFVVPANSSSGSIEVHNAAGFDTSDTELEVTFEEPEAPPGDIPSNGNMIATLTPRIKYLWLVDRKWGTLQNPAVMIRLAGQEDIVSEIGETSNVLTPLGSTRPVRITDSIRGYEGTISGFIETREELVNLEHLKSTGVICRFIGSDLNIPVQLGELSITRDPNEEGFYEVEIQVEQVGEFTMGV
jgi:hypothetical protein